MQIYLVGGAVRDALLKRPVTEHDYVVVGATPQQMLAQGFQAVGKDFPVFLHPMTKEEYALARTERKNGHGYQGFEFYTSPEITLEQDLSRRDLTINAMAQDAHGQIIDPYGGLHDLAQRTLRHVSPAFAEDPLRVLRVARFAARYADLGFTIAEETLQLMRQIAKSGELQHLSAERVWKETARALGEQRAEVFFEVLRACGALAILFPEIDALFGVPQRPEHHPEIDCGIHTMMALQQACQHNYDVIVRFAVLCHDLGKALTPAEILPRHIKHEKRGLPAVHALCTRLKVPSDYQQLALKVCEWHLHCHRLFDLRAGNVWKLLKNLDVLRRPLHTTWFSQACLSDARGRLGFESRDYPQAAALIEIGTQIRNLKIEVPQQLQGQEIGIYLTEKRVMFIKQLMAQMQATAH